MEVPTVTGVVVEEDRRCVMFELVESVDPDDR